MRETSHLISNSVTSVTNGLGIILKTLTVVTIPPHNSIMILLEPPFRTLHCKNVNTELFEVIANPFLNIEQPYLIILHTLHKFDTRYPEQCVVIVVNVGDEDIILNKGMTLCFVQETDLTMKIPQVKEMDTVNTMNNEKMEGPKRETLESYLQEISLDSNRKKCYNSTGKLIPIPENSAFMFHKDFYLKPRITLLDAEFSLRLSSN